MTKKLFLDVDSVGGRMQISISSVDESGRGGGYRIYGPKYAGNSTPLVHAELTADARAMLRKYLDEADSEGPAVTSHLQEYARSELCVMWNRILLDPKMQLPDDVRVRINELFEEATGEPADPASAFVPTEQQERLDWYAANLTKPASDRQ